MSIEKASWFLTSPLSAALPCQVKTDNSNRSITKRSVRFFFLDCIFGKFVPPTASAAISGLDQVFKGILKFYSQPLLSNLSVEVFIRKFNQEDDFLKLCNRGGGMSANTKSLLVNRLWRPLKLASDGLEAWRREMRKMEMRN